MSVATEIERIQTAKETLKTKLNAKNDSEHQITNELISDYGSFVDSISTGVNINDYFADTMSFGNNVGLSAAKMITKFKEPLMVSDDSRGQYLFSGTSISAVPTIEGAIITETNHMFDSCWATSLDVSNLNTANVRDMGFMFTNSKMESIIGLESWNTSNLVSMDNMFARAGSLQSIDLSSFDTSKVTQLSSTFASCSSLTDLDMANWDLSSMYTLQYMCDNCRKLVNLNITNWDTSNVVNMTYMFNYCLALTSIPKLNASKVTNINGALWQTRALSDFGGFENLGEAYLTNQIANNTYYDLDVSESNNLTHDSLMNIINNLYDIATAGVATQLLTLGKTNMAKLTSEEIAIATNKGWTVR